MGKNKKLVWGLGVIVVLGIGVGVYFFTKGSKTAIAPSAVQTETVQQINPTDIGLTLTPRSDNHAIILNVTNLSGISGLDYDISYDAAIAPGASSGDDGGAAGSNVPRGVEGSIQIKSSDSGIKREIELGTCSRNVCKYDKVVSGIKVVIKVSYSNGKVGAITQTVNLQ